MEKIKLNDFLKLNKEDLLGKIIVFPTDTVYGVGCLYLDDKARDKIYNMKKRDYGKSLPILLSKLEDAKKLARIATKDEEYLKYWPGALTIIFVSIDKNYIHPTVALRMPNSNIALAIFDKFGPMEVTSVNYSGEKELNSVEEIEDKFSEFVDYIIIDNQVFSKTPSTIISLANGFKVLREGSIKFN